MRKLLALLLCLFCATVHSERPGRYIALAPHLVEILYSLGVGDDIVGATEFSDYPTQAKNISRVGNYASLQVEKIIALKPDYIFAWKGGNPEADLKRLQRLGLDIEYFYPRQLKDIGQQVRRLGRLVRREQVAHAMADTFDAQLNKVKKRYQKSTRISAFYQVWHQPLTTAAGNSWPQNLMSVCGIENIFSDISIDYPKVSLETVIQRKPEVIIVPKAGHNNPDPDFWSRWQFMPAVREDRVIRIDVDILHRMTPRVLDELKRLCVYIDDIRNQMNKK